MSEDAGLRFTNWPAASRPPLTLVTDSAETAALVDAAGWRAIGFSIDQAETADILVLDWGLQVPGVLPALATDCGLLALVSLETMDAADAVLAGHSVRFVVGSNPVLMATELSELAALVQTRQARDPSSDERARLQSLASELARLAEQLGALSEEGGDDGDGASLADRSLAYQAEEPLDPIPAKPPSAQRIRHLIAMRRLRDRFFRSDLFADPAWDILLDLTASRIEKRQVSVSSLCIAAAVPPTTALRWVRMMTDQGLLERRADPADARRMFVDLSDAAFAKVCGWFAMVEQRGGLGV
ncbi:MarR family winged helix-turn-helix transcriptional regulator [Blastomonas sp. CCH5-A3]|uniref:MarR family winged helix-turn-helix transcriptional regulator n=1 Tax=Blastomonas sp. CCH5-A3 TaxID=1768761 RepID=UPI000AA8C477|nr:MarR family winged helix-turn-helix transcriptional regulator [Blastomonas sp. CCH5-A3]